MGGAQKASPRALPGVALACATGRRALDARKVLGAPIWVAGVHGAEILAPYARRPTPYPGPPKQLPVIRRFARSVADLNLCPSGMHTEDKEVALAFHHLSFSAQEAERQLVIPVRLARDSGLHVVRGRGWTEVRHPHLPHKGDIVAELVRRWRPRRLVVAGDDHGDLAMFGSAQQLTNEGLIEHHICVAVQGMGTPAECGRNADVILDGPLACRTWLRDHAISSVRKPRH
jgi:trehalose-phosphatase